jgi:hypothetical protein
MEELKRDVGTEIMVERIDMGIRIVKDVCKAENMTFSEAMLIKAIEVGISLYIQKEQRSMRGFK